MIAQYDGMIAYMDVCTQAIFEKLDQLGIADDTIVVVNSDHGESLYDHDCYFDHHGLYDVTLRVPLIIRYLRKLAPGKRVGGFNQHKHLVPTLLELADLKVKETFDGPSLMKLVSGEAASFESESYITECTWMRKHGWRTPEWKLIVALEPDFHYKPPVELYNLVEDPHEDVNLVDKHPDVVATLRARMEAFIAQRERELGITNPMLTQADWHGHKGVGAFTSSEQAYNTIYVASAAEAKRRQAKAREKDSASEAVQRPTKA